MKKKSNLSNKILYFEIIFTQRKWKNHIKLNKKEKEKIFTF